MSTPDDDFDLEGEHENFEQQKETDEEYMKRMEEEAMEEEAAKIAAMTKEARAAYEAQKIHDAEQSKLKEELTEEYKPILRRSELASTKNRQRQSFARQAFDNRSNPRHDDDFGGGKKRTIRKKNRKGTRTTIRKRQRKNRTRAMRKKSRK
jgi:hypothetical protein